MNSQRNFRRAKARVVLAALITSFAFCSTILEVRAQVNNEVAGLVYHPQVTSYYCGSATVEMMLDNNAVRQNNPYLNYILNPANAADPVAGSFYNQFTGQDATFGTIPFNAVNNVAQSIHPTYAPRVIPGLNGGNPVSAVTYGPQLAIYDFAHGAGTFTPIAGPNAGVALGYFNPFQPWGSGSGINGQQYELNVFDNPNVGGEGIHAFTAYNIGSFNASNRTIANAIADYQVPAGGVFYGGAHAMAVTGVRTDVQPVRNQPYNILGFFVDDPWNGYAINRGLPANQRGLRRHDFVSNVPELGVPSRWSQMFTPSGGEPGEGAYASGAGFKFVVEPQGPEPLDDGLFGSDPLPAPPLAADLNATDALALAQVLLQSDSDLSSKYGLSGGGFDGSGMSLIDPAGENDWLVPYLHGGSNTGAFLISAHYGILEEASWDEAGELSSSLADLLGEYQGVEAGFHPDDNPVNVPEASTLTLAAIGTLLFGLKRRWLLGTPCSNEWPCKGRM
jgi:hypothetical protein